MDHCHLPQPTAAQDMSTKELNALRTRLENIKRARQTPTAVVQDRDTYYRHLYAQQNGPLHRYGKTPMEVPTHLLAIELVPATGTDMNQPPLPGMPAPLHRLRVHQFHLTTTMGYATHSGTWVESVEDMDYIQPTWLTLPARSTNLDIVCSQVQWEVARTYEYLNTAHGYHLGWYTQQYLEDQDTTLEGQTWERCRAWAMAVTESVLDHEDPRMEAARRILKVRNMPYTHGQSRSQLWVAVGMATGKRYRPGTLAMAQRGQGFKAVRTPRA